jgi:hypothetical protein
VSTQLTKPGESGGGFGGREQGVVLVDHGEGLGAIRRRNDIVLVEGGHCLAVETNP